MHKDYGEGGGKKHKSYISSQQTHLSIRLQSNTWLFLSWRHGFVYHHVHLKRMVYVLAIKTLAELSEPLAPLRRPGNLESIFLHRLSSSSFWVCSGKQAKSNT